MNQLINAASGAPFLVRHVLTGLTAPHEIEGVAFEPCFQHLSRSTLSH